MKKILFFLLTASLLFALTGCAEAKAGDMPTTQIQDTPIPAAEIEPAPETAVETGGKTLVAYFSCTGNTQALAEAAADHLQADIYRIEALEPYTADDIAYYTDCRADREQNDPDARPEIAGQVYDMSQYDTIVLGYPIWHGQAPRIISTFLESYDFSGATIIPFCTSASSGIGSSDKALHELCSAQWVDGRRFASNADAGEILAWLDEITGD